MRLNLNERRAAARADLECVDLATQIYALLPQALDQADHEVEQDPNVVWVPSERPGEWLQVVVTRYERRKGSTS